MSTLYKLLVMPLICMAAMLQCNITHSLLLSMLDIFLPCNVLTLFDRKLWLSIVGYVVFQTAIPFAFAPVIYPAVYEAVK